MDDEPATTVANVKVRKTFPRKAVTVPALILRITGSLVTMVMLLWAIHSGFKLVTNSSRYTSYTDWAFHIGALTMVFGFLFLILGIPILADLFLNLSEQLQEEEAGIHKAWEAKTISKVIAGVFMGLIIMIVMWWAIHTGIRLTKEHKRDSKYHLLTSSIGVVTIVFGLVYFIIGLGIIEELVVDLFDHLQQKERKGNLYLTRLKQ